MEKSLDRKLARILADRSCKDFIIADAKDGDMAYGLAAPGRSPEHYADEARFPLDVLGREARHGHASPLGVLRPFELHRDAHHVTG